MVRVVYPEICNCTNCIPKSISGETHEFTIYAMRHRARAVNLIVCYCKKQMDVSFSYVCPVIDNEFRHNIVKVVCRSTRRPAWQLDRSSSSVARIIG